MKKLDIYIAKQTAIGFLLVTFSLMSIVWLTQSLRFVEMITNKGLPLSLFIKMTSCLMPRIFFMLSPVAAFVTILFVYNRMLADRELVVMKAAGITPWQNAKPIVFIGIILSMFGLYISNFGIPHAERAFEDLHWQVRNNVSHLMFREGEFNTPQPDLTIFIASHEKDGTVRGILVNDERNPKMRVTVSAESGIITYTEKGPRITMVNGVRHEINNQTNQFSSLSFDRYSVDFGSSTSGKKRQDSARSKTLSELLNAASNPELSKHEINRYILEGTRRLLNPFYNLVLALLACTGLLVGSFNRRGQGKIISISITAMVLILAGDLAFGNLAAKNLLWMPLLYVNMILPFTICLYLLFFYNPGRFRKTRAPS